jgi:GTP-binding protein HflX
VIDRERLILDIFNSRATTTEAKLQIQLAEIKYQMPRVRENAKLTPGSKERSGRGGMGEYTVDVKFRDLKRQMSFIKEKLEGAKPIVISSKTGYGIDKLNNASKSSYQINNRYSK